MLLHAEIDKQKVETQLPSAPILAKRLLAVRVFSQFYLSGLGLFDENLDPMYITTGRTYRYNTTPTNANRDPTAVGSTAPNVKVIPMTKPRRHSAR